MDYQRYEEALAASGGAVDLAEVHGNLCARLCALGDRSLEGWLDDALGGMPASAHDDGETRRELSELHAFQWRQLEQRDARFQPLLPPEEYPLAVRVEGLALWCQGFLRGLAHGRLPSQEELTRRGLGDTAEVMSDFDRIVQTGLAAQHAPAEPEESEADYAELVEYLRVAVQTVFEDLEGWRTEAARGDAR